MGAPTNADDASSNEAQEVERVGKSDVSASTLVDYIFHKLNDDQKEHAARASSYRYLVASSSPTEEGRDQRDKHAKATIKRYVTVEQKLGKSNVSPEELEVAAFAKLLKTLAFREEKRADHIRLCFNEDKLADDDGLHATLREGLTERYASKASSIQGYTKDGHAMFQNFPRADTKWENEYFTKGNIYMLERALACTERKTDGEKDKVVVLYDYNGYALSNTPPPLLIKELLYNLRDHWPERLQAVYIVDSPFFFRAFWAIIKHFIDPITKELVQFITGEEQKKILRETISEDQAAPYMFDGGKNGEEIDNKTFFYDTPFDRVYGEEH